MTYKRRVSVIPKLNIHTVSTRSSVETWSLFASIVTFQVLSGVSLRDSLASSLVVGVQTLGGILWARLLLLNHPYSRIETLAVGLSLGSILSTISFQILRETSLETIAWALPSLAGIIFLAPSISDRFRSIPRAGFERELPLLLLVIPLLYADFRQSWLVSIFLVGMSLLLNAYSSPRSKKLNVLAVIALPVGLLTCGLISRQPSVYGPRLLKPLFTGSDDLVFSESLGSSIANFGLVDHAAALGTSVRYHWFSLAWSGLVDRVSQVEPFVVTLHTAPIFSSLCIAGLLMSLCLRLTRSILMGRIAILILFATSLTFDPQRFFTVFNTSNVVSVMWFLLFAYFYSCYLNRELRFPFIVLPLIAVVTLLSKAPYAAAIPVGLIGVFIIDFVRKRSSIANIGMLVVVSVSMVIAYIVWLAPHSWEQRKFVRNFNFLNFTGLDYLAGLATIAVATTLLGALFAPTFVLTKSTLTTQETRFLVFISSGSLVAVLRLVLSGGSGELYFYGIAIVLWALACSWALTQRWSTMSTSQIPIRLYTISAFVPAIVHLSLVSLGLAPSVTSGPDRFFVSSTLVSLVVAVMSASLLRMRTLRVVIVLFLVGSLITSGIRFVVVASNPVEYLSTTEVASNEDVAALTWLRNHSDSHDIVATNRFLCPSDTECAFDDSSFLISAVARRRVLVEGPRFVIGGRPYPQWILDRINLSLRFADSPNDDDLKRIRDLGVSWFFINERFLTSGKFVESIWKDFGVIRYHRDGNAIIELNS